MEAVESVRDTGNRGIEAEGHRRCLQIVVDCLGDSDDRESRPVKLQCRAHRSVTPDGDDGGEIKVAAGLGGLGDHLLWNLHLVATRDP